MLKLTIPGGELWDEKNERFIYTKQKTIALEHSLVSLSKWESKWCKPFLDKSEKTDAEIRDYIRCMTITQNVEDSTYNSITSKNLEDIIKYINAPMTATTFKRRGPVRPSREIMTAEIIYYLMIAFQIPFECQKWHLNRLITLIRVCEIKNQKPKKRSQRDVLNEYAALNAARKAKYKTRG